MADGVVDHVMAYGMRSRDQLYPPDFDAWLKDFPSILIWLEGLAAPWMVTPAQLRAEGGTPKADVPVAPLPSVSQTLGEAYLGLIPDRDRYNDEVALAGLAPIGPGPPGAVMRPLRFPWQAQIGFVWRFCMGAQGAPQPKNVLSPPTTPRAVAWLELARENSTSDACPGPPGAFERPQRSPQ